MTVYFIREAQPDEHHDAAAIRLPPVTCLSHRIMGTFHRNWCEILSRVCNVSRWWLIPDIFLCQCYRVCGIMVERTRNFFVKLDCKELDFSHSTGSFNKNSLSGHQAECWRYRPTWLNNYMIWWYSSGLRELKLKYFLYTCVPLLGRRYVFQGVLGQNAGDSVSLTQVSPASGQHLALWRVRNKSGVCLR